MKYIRNYKKFIDYKNESKIESQFYYYKIGKSTNKSIFECGLITERINIADLNNLKRNLTGFDDLIIESVHSSIVNKTDLFEEINLKSLWQSTKTAWNTGVKFLGDTFNTFTEFLKNIGGVIVNLFKKVVLAMKKLWEITSNASISLAKNVKNWVVSSNKESVLNTLVEVVSDSQFTKESSEVVNDLKSVKERFSTGKVGNMSDENKKKMEEEAEEYKGVDNLEEIGELIGEKFDLSSKETVEKVYYSLKGLMVEGNTIDSIMKVVNESEEYKEGDKVKYKTKSGEEVEKEIKRIEGDKIYFVDKEGKEFYKGRQDIIDLVEGDKVKKVTGKMGIMGWVVECYKLIMKPVEYLVNQSIKLGMNGVLTLVSAFARKGWNNAYKYQKFGPVIGKVNEIISGEDIPESDKEEEDEIQIELDQEENDNQKKSPLKNKKLNSFFKDVSKVLIPVLGQVLCMYFEAQVGPVLTVLKYVLLLVSAIELVSSLCKKGLVKGSVCQISNFSFQ